jgi:ankyrin repeat protein
VEETIETIREVLNQNPSAANQMDALGMTPLHILTVSQKPVVELLQMLSTFVDMAMSSKDSFGSTPFDYLCKNSLIQGKDATGWMIQKVLERRQPFLGLDRWKQELLEA